MKSSNKMMRVILSSSLSGSATQVIATIANLASLPILVTALGKNDYGIWILVGYSLQLLAMSDFGVINSVGRLVAKYKDTPTELHNLIFTISALLSLVGIVIAFCTYFASGMITEALNIDKNNSEIARTVFLIGGFFLALTIPIRIGSGILAGFQRYTTINNSQSALVLINLFLIILFNYFEILGLIELICVFSISSLVIELLRLRASIKLMGDSNYSFKFSKEYVREIASLGASSITTTLTAFGYRQGIVISSAHILSVAEAGIFGICLTIMTSVSKLLSQLSVPVVTLVSERSRQSAKDNTRRMNNTVIGISFGLGLSIFFGIITYSELILHMLFSDSDWQQNDYVSSFWSLVIMSGSLAIGVAQMGSRSILLGKGKHWMVAKVTLIGSLCSILIGIIAMHKFGLSGAALGWSTIWILQGCFVYPILIKTALNQTSINMLIAGYLPGLASSIVVAFFLYILQAWINPKELIPLVICISATVLVGMASLYVASSHISKRYADFKA